MSQASRALPLHQWHPAYLTCKRPRHMITHSNKQPMSLSHLHEECQVRKGAHLGLDGSARVGRQAAVGCAAVH